MERASLRAVEKIKYVRMYMAIITASACLSLYSAIASY